MGSIYVPFVLGLCSYFVIQSIAEADAMQVVFVDGLVISHRRFLFSGCEETNAGRALCGMNAHILLGQGRFEFCVGRLSTIIALRAQT